MLLDLERQRVRLALALAGAERHLNAQRVVDGRHGVRRELDVDDRAGHAGDAAHSGARLGARGVLGDSHVLHSLPAVTVDSASAPPTISLISWVISA